MCTYVLGVFPAGVYFWVHICLMVYFCGHTCLWGVLLSALLSWGVQLGIQYIRLGCTFRCTSVGGGVTFGCTLFKSMPPSWQVLLVEHLSWGVLLCLQLSWVNFCVYNCLRVYFDASVHLSWGVLWVHFCLGVYFRAWIALSNLWIHSKAHGEKSVLHMLCAVHLTHSPTFFVCLFVLFKNASHC